MIKLKTAPAEEPLEMEEAKSHLRVDGTDEDAYITTLIIAAREYCEGFQNRAYITQTWELWLDEWPVLFTVPLPPLQSATIKYYNTSDVEATVTSTDYFVDTKSEPGRIVLNYGKSWPSTTLRPANGICVTFVAGYGYSESVPQKVKQAMLLLIGFWYENRETAAGALGGTDVKELPHAVESLLWQERVF
ncbi:head-tail connector protein [Candidatus Pacearchaeota archaeon]|jgi:uncharacterized phiE125 gp8 family phage protein|nr:head-tail connector protein [Candidatus Pacearchaeota archaeon]